MDLTREALEYLSEKDVYTQEIGNKIFASRKMYEIDGFTPMEPYRMSTLASLAEYVLSLSWDNDRIIVIEGPSSVGVYNENLSHDQRYLEAKAKANIPNFDFNKFVDREWFQIALQSQFVQTEDLKIILGFIRNVKSGSVEEFGDDGVSQKVTISAGPRGAQDVIIPNIVNLKPYRTFVEIEQPTSSFVFRMRDAGAGIQCGLFEADGGAWINEAIRNIKIYLSENISPTDGIAPMVIG